MFSDTFSAAGRVIGKHFLETLRNVTYMYQILTSTQLAIFFLHNTDNTLSKPMWVEINNAQCLGKYIGARTEYMELNKTSYEPL